MTETPDRIRVVVTEAEVIGPFPPDDDRATDYVTATALEAAQARIVELQDKVLLAYNLAKKAEDFRKTARREALEEAAGLHIEVADLIGAQAGSSIHSALCEYYNRIRALMENPNG